MLLLVRLRTAKEVSACDRVGTCSDKYLKGASKAFDPGSRERGAEACRGRGARAPSTRGGARSTGVDSGRLGGPRSATPGPLAGADSGASGGARTPGRC